MLDASAFAEAMADKRYLILVTKEKIEHPIGYAQGYGLFRAG
jgi:hypothetical protein